MEIKRKKENKAKENYHLSFLLLSLSLSLISFSPPRNDTSNHSRVTQRANGKKWQKAQKKKKARGTKESKTPRGEREQGRKFRRRRSLLAPNALSLSLSRLPQPPRGSQIGLAPKQACFSGSG